MPRPKPTVEDLKERKKRALEWKTFRQNYKLTQRALADLMADSEDNGAGCRRTIQMVEAGLITPHRNTLQRFQIIKNRVIAENIE